MNFQESEPKIKQKDKSSEDKSSGNKWADNKMDHLWNNCSLSRIYDASVFLKTTLSDVRYQSAQQMVANIQSDPPSPLNAHICVHIIVGQLDFHRQYLSAIHIVFMYYWDIVRKDNIVNKVLLQLSNNFQIDNTFIRETISRADKCLKRIEKEMLNISVTISSANIIVWRYCEELNQIKLWSNHSPPNNASNQVLNINHIL